MPDAVYNILVSEVRRIYKNKCLSEDTDFSCGRLSVRYLAAVNEVYILTDNGYW